jgi:hypothetical protein
VTEDELRAEIERLREEINDYRQSIQAMIGFVNFYVYDDAKKRMRSDVIVFQGWDLIPTSGKDAQPPPGAASVTPDFGILMPDRKGVVGEVKKSFPRDHERWSKAFRQLMGYDNNLLGWPSEDGAVDDHDVVLLTHQSRAVAVGDYYLAKQESGEVRFTKPFVIVEFNESVEARPFYFFRRTLGQLSHRLLDGRLREGVQVPMEVLVEKYSTIRFYDAPPQQPYMIEQIWTNVVTPAAADLPGFKALHRRTQKLDIVVTVDQIVDQLREGFSFRPINCDEDRARVPERGWVKDACQAIVDLDEGEWADTEKTTLTVRFRKYDDVLEHFVVACARAAVAKSELAKQRTLFK